MKKWEYKVTNSQGLHARPAGLLVREARKYVSRVLLESSFPHRADARCFLSGIAGQEDAPVNNNAVCKSSDTS